MFWSNAAASSALDTILEDPSTTFEKVLEQDEVLQELRAMNKKLLEYLSRPEALEKMVDMITSQPPSSIPLPLQYKLPNVSCEVLTSDPSFIERITGEKTLLTKLFAFFRENEAPINPLLAAYVCRVLSEIITRKAEQNWYSYQLNLVQIMGFLQQPEENVLQLLLNHLDCSSVCEFLYKLVTQVEGQEMRQTLFEWLITKEKLFERLMEKMTRQELEEVHVNVGRLVGDLLFSFQDEMMNSASQAECDPFLTALRSYETVKALMTTLFNPDNICETSVIHGLDLLLSLIGIMRRSPRQSGRNDCLGMEFDDDPETLIFLTEEMRKELISVFPTLLQLLKSPTDPTPIPMSYGVLESPVGLGRLAIAKFIAHLLTLQDEELNLGIIEKGVIHQLMELFWKNPYNNFLHRYVSEILISLVKIKQKTDVTKKCVQLLVDEEKLLSKILQVFEEKDAYGYRGYLAKVAETWGEAIVNEDLIKEAVQGDAEVFKKWEIFYGDTLESYISREKVLLAGVPPPVSGGLLSNSGGILGLGLGLEGSEGGGGGEAFSSSASQWLSFAQSQLNFDPTSEAADSFLNLTLGSDKARSLFEMLCDEKSDSFDDHERRHSLPLSSSDEEEAAEEDEEGEGPEGQGPSVLLKDPWSDSGQDQKKGDEGAPSSAQNNGDDVWNDPDLLFGSGSGADMDSSAGADWANFDNNSGAGTGAGEEESWANFQSAGFPSEGNSAITSDKVAEGPPPDGVVEVSKNSDSNSENQASANASNIAPPSCQQEVSATN